jgi:glucan 1,3-beta-glucosidase
MFSQRSPVAAPYPFPTSSAFNDPDVSSLGSALALSIQDSSYVLIYGAGLYSFFRAYTQNCLGDSTCQSQITQVTNSQAITIYSLSTIGATYQLVLDGQPTINPALNVDGFASTVTAWSSDPLSSVSRKLVRRHRIALPLRLRGVAHVS